MCTVKGTTASLKFTFHYVSIKSTLYFVDQTILSEFTFHYVSIKSDTALTKNHVQQSFTFHYVSIKSWAHRR